jgi:Sulfotransferase family
MPKTGTTFLQARCFPFLKGIRYRDPALMNLLDCIAYTNPAFLDLHLIKQEVDRIMSASADTLLISHERLFGNMLANFWDHTHITSCLKHLFPDGRIILVIRRQDELAESIYKQSLQSGYHQRIDSFLNYRKKTFQDAGDHLGQPNLDVKQLDLHRYAQSYAAQFGRKNLLVLPYELLRVNQEAFLDRLFSFIGVEPFYPPLNGRENRSYSWLSSHVALLLNRFVRAEGDGSRFLQFIPNKPFSSFLDSTPSDRRFDKALRALNRRLTLRHILQNGLDKVVYTNRSLISAKKREMIVEVHRETNKRLGAEFDLNLNCFGYY